MIPSCKSTASGSRIWIGVPSRSALRRAIRSKGGSPAHPETGYITAFLIRIKHKHVCMTELPHYVVQHP